MQYPLPSLGDVLVRGEREIGGISLDVLDYLEQTANLLLAHSSLKDNFGKLEVDTRAKRVPRILEVLEELGGRRGHRSLSLVLIEVVGARVNPTARMILDFEVIELRSVI